MEDIPLLNMAVRSGLAAIWAATTGDQRLAGMYENGVGRVL
jgi:hypothetical protein